MKNKTSRWNLIPKIIRKDFFRKFLALLFASLIWFLVNNKLGIDGEINELQVQFEIPKGLYVNTNDKVTLKIKASKGKISTLSSKDFVIKKIIKESQYANGDPISIKLREIDIIKKPSGVQIIGIEPNEIIINIDKILTKDIDIRYVLDKKCQLDSKYDSEISIQPESIKITGPKKEVSAVNELITEPISMDKIESFTTWLNILNTNKNIALSSDKVYASVEIYTKYETREFNIPKEKIKIMQPDNIDSVFLNENIEVIAQIKGLRKKTEAFLGEDISVFVDLLNIKKSGIIDAQLGASYEKKKSKKKNVKIEKDPVTITVFPKTVKMKIIVKQGIE